MADDQKPSVKERLKSYLTFSLATTVAAAVGISLVLLAALAWLLYALDPSRIAWGDYMTIERAVILLTLWVAACAATYLTVRVWMSDVTIGDSRVRDGWNAGISLLSKHGVKLSDRPCFVVLGCLTRHQQDLWVGRDGYGTSAPEAQSTPSIDWHLDDDRILIFCRGVGVYAGLLSNADSTDADNRSVDLAIDPGGMAPSLAGQSTVAGETNESEHTTDADPSIDPDPSCQQADEDLHSESDDQTPLVTSAQQTAEGPTTAAAAPPTAVTTASLPKASSTNHAMKSLDRVDELVRDAQRIEPVAMESRPLPASLSSIETADYQETLSQFCARLRGSRFPHSGINGTLVVVDSELLSEESSARKVGRAIGSDLNQIRSELGVWSPATVMVAETSLQQDQNELFRRLRIAEQDKTVPLGQPFDPEQIATVEAMNELADDAIGQVENRINRVFQVPRALAQPQNHRLVRVLIQCRRWRTALRALLVESCAIEATSTPSIAQSETPIVGGLFVASPSDSPITQSFVQSIFRRMVGQQNHLAWTAHHQRRAAGHRRAVRFLITATVLFSVALLVQLVAVFQR